jgi:hypothetical protein
MQEGTKPRLFFVSTTLLFGTLGELLSSDLFNLGVSLEGVLSLQILFIALTLIGIYSGLAMLRPNRVMPQSLSHQAPENPINMSSDAKEEHPLQSKTFRSSLVKIALKIIAGVSLVILLLIWLWSNIASLGLLSYFPVFFPGYALGLMTSVSFDAGIVFASLTAALLVWSESKFIPKLSLVTMIVTGIVWIYVEWFAYGILIEYLGYLDLLEYIAIARMSSYALLASTFITTVGFGVFWRIPSPNRSKSDTR